MKIRLLSTLAISLALGACVTTGGGYGPGSTRPIRADGQPYLGEFPRNSALIKFDEKVYEQQAYGDQPLAWAIGDFHGDGSTSIFTATQRYNAQMALDTIKENPDRWVSMMRLFHVDKKTGKQELSWSMVGCLHPRHAAAADFNNDGKLDVVVGCQGYEREFNQAGLTQPGEYSVLLLNNGKGGFAASKFGTSSSFYHGIDAGDVNGDGYADVVVAAPEGKDPNVQPQVFFWINQKDGTFKKDFNRISRLQNGPYTFSKLVDVDGDGILDLMVGGEETNGAETSVLYGTKEGKFGSEKINIPAMRNDQGLSLDIVPVTHNGERVLYVLRTADHGNQRTYYKGMTIQAINLTTGKETIYRSGRSWLSDILPATKDGQNGVAPYDWNKGGWFISNAFVDAPK